MSDDLVKRLRGRAETVRMFLAGYTALDVEEAADRIEQLEAALRRIVTMTPDPEFGAFPIESAIDVARTALEGKDD
jgi:hypothetical protein